MKTLKNKLIEGIPILKNKNRVKLKWWVSNPRCNTDKDLLLRLSFNHHSTLNLMVEKN